MDTTSLRYRLRRHLGLRLAVPLLRLCARRGWAGWAAVLLRPQIIPLTKGPRDSAALDIIVLPKPGFVEDIAASLGHDPRFRIHAFDRLLLKTVFRAFLPPIIDDKNYISAPAEFDAPKAALRKFWYDVWSRIDPARRYGGVLTANFGYHAEQEFTAALDAHGTAVIAVHKENLKTPGLEAFFENLYRERKLPFQGRAICTYNQIEKNIEVAAGMAAADAVMVTGMPRLDKIHQWRGSQGAVRRTGSRPTVLFFSFAPKTGAPLIQRKWPKQFPPARETLAPELEAIGWPELSRSCHQAIVRVAQENPGLDVVIKSKGDLRARGILGEVYGEDYSFPENLTLVTSGDPFNLITQADVVCGFNSTALLETLAAGVPVIVPVFAEATNAANVPYMMDLGMAVETAASADELVTQLVARARVAHARGHGTELGDTARAALDHWLGNADGRSGTRIADAVFTVIAGSKV